MKHFIIYFGVVLIQLVFGLISAPLLRLISFQLCFKNVLFGFFLYSYRKEYLINLLLLLAKFSIHKCKFGGNKPLFLILKSEIQQYLFRFCIRSFICDNKKNNMITFDECFFSLDLV